MYRIVGCTEEDGRFGRLDDATDPIHDLIGNSSSEPHLMRHDDHRHPSVGKIDHRVEDFADNLGSRVKVGSSCSYILAGLQ